MFAGLGDGRPGTPRGGSHGAWRDPRFRGQGGRCKTDGVAHGAQGEGRGWSEQGCSRTRPLPPRKHFQYPGEDCHGSALRRTKGRTTASVRGGRVEILRRAQCAMTRWTDSRQAWACRLRYPRFHDRLRACHARVLSDTEAMRVQWTRFVFIQFACHARAAGMAQAWFTRGGETSKQKDGGCSHAHERRPIGRGLLA